MPNQVVFSFVAADRFSAVARKVSQSVTSIQMSLMATSIQAERFGKSMTKAGRAMQSTSLVASAAAIASLKAFGDIEQGVVNVLTQLEDADASRFRGEIEKTITAAVREGFAIGDASEALKAHVRSMGASPASFRAFEAAQRLATASSAELAPTVAGVSRVVSLYGENVLSAERASSAFFSGARRGGVDVGELMDGIGKIAPLAAGTGIAFEDLVATTSELTRRGLSMADSVGAMRGSLMAVLKPSKDGERILRAFNVPVGAAEVKAAGLGATLAQLAVVAEKYPDLLAQAVPNIKAFAAAASLDPVALDRIQATIAEIERGAAVNRAYALQQSTFNDAVADSFGKLKTLGGLIGAGLVPVVLFLGKALDVVISVVEFLGPGFQGAIGLIVGALALAAPVLLVLGKLGLAVSAVATGIGAVFASPVVLIGVLVASVAAGTALVLANIDKIKAAMTDGIPGLTAAGGALDFSDKLVSLFSRSETDVNINLNAPKGAIKSVTSETSGDAPGLNLGMNMAGAL